MTKSGWIFRIGLVFGWGILIAAWAGPRVPHVVIISMDGAAPWVVRHTPMPVVHQLFREGAATWDAETTRPTVTLPSHTSMLTGVGPARHGITWNDWRPTNGVVQVPTIFAAAKQTGLTTAMFVGKKKLLHLLQPGTVDHFDYAGRAWSAAPPAAPGPFNEARLDHDGQPVTQARAVARRAADFLQQRKPNLCFIHLGDPDVVGHKYGWGSPEQRRSLQDVDAAVEEILRSLRQAGLRSRTVVLITADHGGQGKGHSAGTLEDLKIPWIAWGFGVRSGHRLSSVIHTCDTAATALWLLEAAPLVRLEGRPVREAFTFNAPSPTADSGPTQAQASLQAQ
ncbi:MAG: alkaline phosphatase family protein [Verrucomicrobiota bacterium]|nr:alkaline phosphatase family protein [Limisphaera sp.]MDW8381968.1 alkaline phosphatase family protein [Verrucomicrobiota bacterium]